MGLMVISLLNNVLAATWKKSPNQPPNNAPQIKVEIPQKKNILNIRYIMPSGLYFFSTKKHNTERMIPYAASESIIPKKMK